MSLHSLASSIVGAINPNMRILIQTSAGYTTNPDFSRTPAYNPAFSAKAQVQELTTRDLMQLEALNVQGSMRTLYISGEIDAIVRLTQKGGDIITLEDDSVWLTTHVLEQFYDKMKPSWVKVSITEQVDQTTIGPP